MGACASCLGDSHHRRGSFIHQDEIESGPLLFTVPYGLHYGSFGELQMFPDPQDDSVRMRREIEALQSVMARISDSMIDVYEDAPGHASLPNAVFSGSLLDQQARRKQYRYLLSRLRRDEASAFGPSIVVKEEFENGKRHNGLSRVRSESGAALVGTFGDAAAATTTSGQEGGARRRQDRKKGQMS